MNERENMAKKDTSLEVKKVAGVELPDFMRDKDVVGLEALAEFVIPPRIKMVSLQSTKLLETFRAGDVVLTPTNSIIVEPDRDDRGSLLEDGERSFNFTPIFFYPEWITWNDIKLKGQEDATLYRTTDPTDPIVSKARDKNLREEDHPTVDKMKIRHVEHLNYIIILQDHPLAGQPALISFSRGEWFAGSNLASLLKMRKASIFGCVFTATVEFRKGKLGDWYGLDIANPSNRVPWVEKEQYTAFEALHNEFKEHHKNSRLKASFDDEEAVDPAKIAPSEDM